MISCDYDEQEIKFQLNLILTFFRSIFRPTHNMCAWENGVSMPNAERTVTFSTYPNKWIWYSLYLSFPVYLQQNFTSLLLPQLTEQTVEF